MATKEALDALQKTDLALQDIRTKLQPFLATLESHADSNNTSNTSNTNNNQGPKPAKLALSQTAVALSLGTLRFMGARLRGRKVDDPVRKELNHMRKLLVTLQQQQQQGKQSQQPQGKQSKQAKQKVKAQAAVKAPVVKETAPEPASPAEVAKEEAPPKSGSKRKESSSSKKEASKRRSKPKR